MQFSRQQQHWVLAAQSGDRNGLDRLLQSIQEPLFSYLTQITQDRHLAEDVLQDTFLQVYRKLYWLREPAAFPAWAYRIASRLAFRALKRRRRDTWDRIDEIPDEDARDGENPPDAEWLEQLPGWLADLSPASRAVISLHYLNEMSLAEVADVLGISIGTVKSRLAYGLCQLRRRLHPAVAETTLTTKS